jgi:hypothetical protein
MPTPVMVSPSPVSSLAFVVLVLGLAGLFVAGVAAANSSGEPPAQKRRRALQAGLGCAAWLTLTAAISASGLLRRDFFPPPLALFFGTSMLVALVAALSPLGARLARGVPIAALVAVQGFRLPLELILQRWHVEGVLPVQMTFEGRNFDIVSGVLALALGAWLHFGSRRRVQRAAVWAFNLIGMGLLLNVSAIAVLSSPLPIRQYLNDPPVLLAFYAPYSWIVPFCVGGALFGHVVSFRSLLAQSFAGTEALPRKVRANAAAAPM